MITTFLVFFTLATLVSLNWPSHSLDSCEQRKENLSGHRPDWITFCSVLFFFFNRTCFTHSNDWHLPRMKDESSDFASSNPDCYSWVLCMQTRPLIRQKQETLLHALVMKITWTGCTACLIRKRGERWTFLKFRGRIT